MASLTIRNIPDDAKQRFRQVAAAHGRSMEEHLRQIILQAAEGAGSSSVQEERSGFGHEPRNVSPWVLDPNWVEDLRRIANGAGEGVFDREPEPLRDSDL